MSSDNVPMNVEINVALVRQLVAAQFPQWAELPIQPVDLSGWDNRTFHLGDDMTVRLPSAEGYVPQVAKEQRWLPYLAPLLPLPIPVPLAKGVPSDIYPWPWTVNKWLDGENAARERIADLPRFAEALGSFLLALQRIDASNGPPAGAHSAFRGAPLAVYDAETRNAVATLADGIDSRVAIAVWEAAVQTTWQSAPVWFHGDVTAGNLLIQHGELSAVIDFGCCGVGDPACDLVIAWTFFTGESRAAFRAALPLDAATWARGRGWALWKALITIVQYRHTDATKAEEAHRVLAEVLADHQRETEVSRE
jgi:aminoglycoside phosphotransferase (APT) family kinase protein